jgi:hypothetical protein
MFAGENRLRVARKSRRNVFQICRELQGRCSVSRIRFQRLCVSDRKVGGVDCKGRFFAGELQIATLGSLGNLNVAKKNRVLFVTLGGIQRDVDVQCPAHRIDIDR